MTGYPEVILRIGPDKRACWRTASKELCNRRTQLTSRLRLPTWNSLPLPIACDLLGTHLPPYIYEIPFPFRPDAVRNHNGIVFGFTVLACRIARSRTSSSVPEITMEQASLPGNGGNRSLWRFWPFCLLWKRRRDSTYLVKNFA